jgi:hypothetical protein
MGGEDFGCDGVLVYVDECAVTVSKRLKPGVVGVVLGNIEPERRLTRIRKGRERSLRLRRNVLSCSR